jgi:hypothetical protein
VENSVSEQVFTRYSKEQEEKEQAVPRDLVL